MVRPFIWRRLCLCMLALGLVSTNWLGMRPNVVRAASNDVVISQVYGGGGNTGAPFTNDFIVLFNRGAVAVAIDGWSVQYAAATGTSWNVTALAGSMQPGQSYLVQQAAGGTASAALPTADATGTALMSASAGKVAPSRW